MKACKLLTKKPVKCISLDKFLSKKSSACELNISQHPLDTSNSLSISSSPCPYSSKSSCSSNNSESISVCSDDDKHNPCGDPKVLDSHKNSTVLDWSCYGRKQHAVEAAGSDPSQSIIHYRLCYTRQSN